MAKAAAILNKSPRLRKVRKIVDRGRSSSKAYRSNAAITRAFCLNAR